jgi:hypothetical protein
MEVTLNIYTSGDFKQIVMNSDRLTIGRDPTNTVSLDDDGLSRLHSSVHRDGNRLWILDEGSTNGSFVNGASVPPVGTPLKDGDEISIGNQTTIVVSFNSRSAAVAAPGIDEFAAQPPTFQANAGASGGFSAPLKLALMFAALVILIAGVALASRAFRETPVDKPARNQEGRPEVLTSSENSNSPEPTREPQVTPASNESASASPAPSTGLAVVPVGSRKLYLQMNQDEQLAFIEKEARHVSLMMGNRSYAFNDDVLRYIKQYVDGYARRVGNNSSKLWGEDLRSMFARAREQFAPYIIRSFNARGVPPVVGLYLVVVETEYHNITSENAAGAAGLFQFIGPTARGYGVDPSERTNVSKMAPAAAAYMADRIAEFGTDSMSVALAIAGYNRSPDSVRRDLHDVLNSENKERSFWTLVANSNKLDHYFQGENIKYVPKFFAAAIVGENPWVFGIQMQPLSTYAEIKAAAETSAK